MIEKKTVIDQIEITRSGAVNIRFALLIIDNGVEVASRWHRTAVAPDGDVDAQIIAVNADITARPGLRAAALAPDETTAGLKVAALKSICSVLRPADVGKPVNA